jgi:predicted ribosomally synthesized peptide with nif11-like leader
MDNMKKLYEKVAADNALREKFNKIIASAEQAGAEQTMEELIALAKQAEFEVTAEEIATFFTAMTEKSEGELTDSELDAVAGGKESGLKTLCSFCYVGLKIMPLGDCAGDPQLRVVEKQM